MREKMTPPKPGELVTIRERERFNAGPPEGMRQTWTEWQVVGSGRRVLGRFDLDSQARAWVDRHGGVVTAS